jgi:ribonucleoside-diphosphate reductase alpha chain
MFVTKRDGTLESMKFEKIRFRLENLSKGLEKVDISLVCKKVIEGLYDGVSTYQIDNLTCEILASMSVINPEYSLLACYVAISNLHKSTSNSFSSLAKRLYNFFDKKINENAPLINSETYEIIQKNAVFFDSNIDYQRDYLFDYFGFKTLEKSYLLKIDGKVVERPQDLFLRVAIGIHKDDLEKVINTYNLMSKKFFIHATPTLFNSGTVKPQLSSCFLLTMQEDSIDGIYETLKQCAKISQSAGGIGLSIHNIRAKGSYIKGTNGISNGIVPMLRNFDMTARYVDQGGGKRKGSFAIYLEPWHADIFEFLELKKNHGKEELRARDLFYALWIPDLFMKRVEKNEKWSLFCPKECPFLDEVYGEKFDILYQKYENENKFRKQINAQELWFKIIESQIETGIPYMLYKDACNEKSNQKNLGTIKSSNLCTEIIQYTSKDEIAVCNLSSISLPSFFDTKRLFDYQKLYEVTYTITENLNKIIDINYYPVLESKNSNLKHRPIGIGVQGLADLFLKIKIPFDCDIAKKLNKEIFETIYFASMKCSIDLAKKFGPYDSYIGSPLSKGLFQFDLWNKKSEFNLWNWEDLKDELKKYGARNSLLIAPMPTASTSQILGNNECFEPYTSNIYVRRTLSGEFIVINKFLIEDLENLGIWNEKIKNKLIAENGSVQNIEEISDSLKLIYRTVWEISQKSIIDMAYDRAPFICQSQSLNLHISEPTFSKVTSMHFYAWKKGLKTGMYYLRTKAATDAIKFTVEKISNNNFEKKECSATQEQDCLMCSG